MSKFKLNEGQQKAVDFKDGNCGVISAAGSGKTTVILERVRELVKTHGVFEKDVLVISFTRNTVNELTQKLSNMGLGHVNVGTFHSICGEILRKEGHKITPYSMVQEWQADNVFKKIDQMADTKDILSFISYQKNYMRSYDDEFVEKDSMYTEKELRKFYRAYENMKKKEGKYDFDDYLLLGLEVAKENPGRYKFEYILVDEHQDSNEVQNLLLREWCQSDNLFVVGDVVQAIYGFRGSNPDLLMNFSKDWNNVKTINVNVNYRSAKNIVEKSNEFIKQYYGEYDFYKDAIAHNQKDGLIETNSYMSRPEEAMEIGKKIQELLNSGVEPKDIAVLYRNNKHADFVENQLKRREIDYEIANDGSFYKRREIAGILSFLRLISDTGDNNAFEGCFRFRTDPLKYMSNTIFSNAQRYANDNGVTLYEAMLDMSYSQAWQKNNMKSFRNSINRLKMQLSGGASVVSLIEGVVKEFKIKQTIDEKYSNLVERDERLESIEILKSFVGDNNLDEFIEYVYSDTSKKKKKDNAVQLMTIHRSKGLEWDNVFVIGVEDDEFPSQKDGAMNDIMEEARLFYVAVSRSKENMWISEIGMGNRFLREYGYIGRSGVDSVSDEDIVESIAEKMGE